MTDEHTYQQTYQDLMVKIASFGEKAHLATYHEITNGEITKWQDAYVETDTDFLYESECEILFTYADEGIYRMKSAINNPRWTHLHAVRRGLEQYINRLDTNNEAVFAYGSDSFMKFEKDARRLAQSLLDGVNGLIQEMLNETEMHELPEDAAEYAERLIQEEIEKAGNA